MFNPLPYFFNILVSPGSTLAALRERPRFYYPFLAVLLSQVLVIVVYFQVVNFDWLVENMAAAMPADMSPQARQGAAEFNRQLGPTMMTAIGAVSLVVMFSLFWSIGAGYLTLVSSLRSDEIKFRQWFGLECWASVPMILVALASFVTIWLNSDGQLAQDKLNPFTLNNLIFHRDVGEPGAGLFGAMDLSLIWSVAIKVIGYRTWTDSKWGVVAAIVVAPYVLIFGGWATIAFS